VLSVYTRPHDPDRPLVCLDETTKHPTKETRTPVPYAKTATGAARLRIRAQRYGQWQCDRNRNHAKADWHFTTENARINSSTSTLHFE